MKDIGTMPIVQSPQSPLLNAGDFCSHCKNPLIIKPELIDLDGRHTELRGYCLNCGETYTFN